MRILNYAEVEVRPALRRSDKIKPIVSAILAEAEKQGATKYELEKSCELAVLMIREEMSVSSMVIGEFAGKAKTVLESL